MTVSPEKIAAMIPVAERLSDEKIAEIIKGCEGVTPGPWEYLDIGEVWHAVEADDNHTPVAVTDHGDQTGEHIGRLDPQTILSALTELQHRRAAEAGATWPPLVDLGRVLGFFASVIKSGEPWSETCQREYEAANAALQAVYAASPSSPATGVRVKALEWRQSFDGMTRADTIVGRYEIWTYHEAGEWFWKREGSLTRAVADEAAAKAECQSDYDAKVRSALGEQS